MDDAQEVTHGLYGHIGDKPIQQFPTYGDEVTTFLAQPPEARPPVVNQEKTITDVLRAASSGYSNCILVGEAGTGRFGVLEYNAQLLTGKQSLTGLPFKQHAQPYLEEILKKPGLFVPRDYLSLPNMHVPKKPVMITYTDAARLQEDAFVVQNFYTQIIDFVNSFIRREDTPQVIGPNFQAVIDVDKQKRPREEFVCDVQYKIHEFFIDVYTEVKEIMDEAYDDSRSRKPIAVVDFTIPEEGSEGQYTWKVSWEFLKDQKVRIPTNKKAFMKAAGYERKKTPKQADLQNRLAKKIKENYTSKLEQLIKDVVGDQYVELKSEERFALFKDQFSEYLARNITPIRSDYADNFIANQSAVLNMLLMRGPTQDLSVDNFVNNLSKIRAAHRVGTTDAVQQWMDTVLDYFQEKKSLISTELVTIMRDYQVAKKRKEKQEEESEEEPPEDGADKYSLRIQHGNCRMALENIFKPHILRGTTEKTYKVMNNFAGKGIFGNFIDHDERTPPHLTMQSLGEFFTSDIIIFRDSFNKFINILCRESDELEKDENMRTQFFDYLDNGTLNVINNGITYAIEKPGIIFACDIENPLYSRYDGGVREEHEIESRMNLVLGESFVKNTPHARQGTLSFFRDGVADFNKRHKTNIQLLPEAAHMLLMDMVDSDSGILGLGYGEMNAALENLFLKALAGKTNITPELLKKHFRDELSVDFFSAIDSCKEFGGYFDLPPAVVGKVHGLYVTEDDVAGLSSVYSYYVPLLDPLRIHESRFELVEAKAGLAGQSEIKGFELVTNYLQRLLAPYHEQWKKCNWKIVTEFKDEFEPQDGPSASTAIAVSVLSALSGTPLYKNRFLTGTLDPEGQVGVIGGTYWKALVPLRIQELAKERKAETPMYFIFPAGNILDLSKELAYDPFNLDENVCLLPISTIAQAYHYFTVDKITEEEILHAQEHGSKKLEQDLERIIQNLKENTVPTGK
ncbi:MAG: S16 family serine protease [archaeon]